MSTLHTSSFCLLHFTVLGVVVLFQHAWFRACECCIDYLCQCVCVCVHACVCACMRACVPAQACECVLLCVCV